MLIRQEPKSSEELVEVHRRGRQDCVDRIAGNALQPIAFQPVFVLQMSDAWLDRGAAFFPRFSSNSCCLWGILNLISPRFTSIYAAFIGFSGSTNLLIQAQNAPETREIQISALSGNIGCNGCKASFDEWNPLVVQDKSRKDVKK